MGKKSKAKNGTFAKIGSIIVTVLFSILMLLSSVEHFDSSYINILDFLKGGSKGQNSSDSLSGTISEIEGSKLVKSESKSSAVNNKDNITESNTMKEEEESSKPALDKETKETEAESTKSTESDNNDLKETELTANIPGSVIAGNSVTISGKLFEKASNKPISAEDITIVLENIQKIETSLKVIAKTNDKGNFSTELNPLIDKKKVSTISFDILDKVTGNCAVSYLGSELYMPSEKRSAVNFLIIYWNRVLFTLIVIIGILLLIFLSFKTNIFNQLHNIIIKFLKEIKLKGLSLNTAHEKSISGDSLTKIIFPEIKSNFPDVWGINEPLLIEVSSKSEHPEIDLIINNITKIQGSYSNENLGFIYRHVFNDKGIYELKAVWMGTNDTVTKRNIKIVEYREEIISNTRELFKVFYKTYNSLNDTLTPREIYYRIINNVNNAQNTQNKTAAKELTQKTIMPPIPAATLVTSDQTAALLAISDQSAATTSTSAASVLSANEIESLYEIVTIFEACTYGIAEIKLTDYEKFYILYSKLTENRFFLK